MKITTQHILIFMGLMLFGMMACLPLALVGISQQQQPDTAATQFAATVQAMVTQQAPTQAPPTQMVIPTTTSIAPTATAIPTRTPVSYCYWVEFIKDVTVPDGTVLAPNARLVKTWRLRNNGNCAWTTDTKLVFTSGAQMNG